MSTKQEAAMRQALEALEYVLKPTADFDEAVCQKLHDTAITGLREALAEQATKPDWKSEATALRVNEQNLEAKLAQAPAPGLDTLAEARAYADQRWDGEDVPIEWLRHFVDGLGRQAAQQAAEPNAVLVEGFSQVALRKLNDLREKGYAVNGVSIASISEAGETNRGAVTTGGMVLWWPQQPAQQPLTDDQINILINGHGEEGDHDYVEPTGDGLGLTDADLVRLVRRAEAAHGITGNAP